MPKAIYAELERGVAHPDETIALGSAKIMIDAFPERAPALIFRRLKSCSLAMRDRLIRMLEPFNSPEFCEQLLAVNPAPSVKKIIAELEPGERFGEMSMLDDLARSATVHVLEDSCALSLEKARLRALIIHYPELALGMLRGFSIRLREAHDRPKLLR